MQPVPFTVSVPQADIDDLRHRLLDTRWSPAPRGAGWEYGMDDATLRSFVDYWRDDFDWQAVEARINAFDQFLMEIEAGVPLHFLHVRGKGRKVVPLLLTHGWPWSFWDWHALIGPLTDPAAHGGDNTDAFHLVLPSLPGFGFSGKPTAPGWGVDRIGRAWGQLMARLGYDRYVAQGGDWGAVVTSSIGLSETKHCAGIHVNMPVLSPSEAVMGDLTDLERDALAGSQYYWDWDSGYSKEQSTRPQTVGYGLVDSPVGQMAWILEKFWSWTDSDGHPENVLTRDELLDNIMMYWLPAAAASSARLYWESFSILGQQQKPISMPAGASIFPHEIFRASRRWVEERYTNLVHFNVLEKGGHFAAFEQPDTFVNEVRTCFRNMR